MPHPSEYFIRFLMAKSWPQEETSDTVNQALTTFSLPEISGSTLEDIKATFHPPKSFQYQNPKHQLTEQFILDQKIHLLWKPGPDEKAALELMGKPQVKEKIQILLMKCGIIPTFEIAERINTLYRCKIPPKAIDVFKHYFWNAERVGFQEWSNYLFGFFMRDSYLKALWGSRDQALYCAGFSPRVDAKSALREAFRVLAFRIEATALLPDTRETASIISSLTKELVSVHNVLFGEGAGVEEAMLELKRFRMNRTAKKPPALQLVAPAGNYSGSGKEPES